MQFPRPVFLITALLLGGGAHARAQEIDLNQIFSNDGFYEAHDIVRATGEVGFVADVWVLPGPADSASVLLGVSLANEALQFVRTSEGQWQATYEVGVEFESEGNGSAPPAERWDKSVEVASFDETLLTGETIVFQTRIAAVPGTYELKLTVRDLNADDGSRATIMVEVPRVPSQQVALSEPVLLRLYEPRGSEVDYVVNPTHYYGSAPSEFDFLIEVDGIEAAATAYRLEARLFPVNGAEERDSGERPAADPSGVASVWTDSLSPEPEGPTRVFGTLENSDARFGEYRLVVDLTGAGGEVLASASTPLLVAGSSGWIVENWDDALSLIRYEATRREMDILEDIEDAERRIDAWNCFWQIRDPVPSTTANEGMQEYFRKIQIANNEWRSALRPGYLSDRGRVFITLGPPDDVSQRPMPAGSAPFEVWTYHRHNFQILFVDRIGFNNYQLESIGVYQRELASIERRKRQFLEERAGECPLLAPAFASEDR
ncbi:MAG TPA: GWxTD domain-containing protein [Gemmatimonadota bacterium]|nr:GWxTD domain-containing protein [Gemmatimonadota bacterium]